MVLKAELVILSPLVLTTQKLMYPDKHEHGLIETMSSSKIVS